MKQKIEDREVALRAASEAYYNEQPIMSDAEFDKLWREHQQDRVHFPELFPTDTILFRVGSAPSGFRTVKHELPMLSLDNVFADEFMESEELEKWIRETGPASLTGIIAEPKYDGLSLSLVYENGILARAVTRGDGFEGDDVLANVLAGKLAPDTIIPDAPWSGAGSEEDRRGIIEVRGEVVISFSQFERLNAESADKPYANPRNAAAGSLRLHDPQEAARRGLEFVAYACVRGAPATRTTLEDSLLFLRSLGFKTPAFMLFQPGDAVDASLLKAALCSACRFPTDGVVLKLNSFSAHEKLGSTSRAPRWAVALKFPQERVTTRLKAITVQVGRSGVLTPVAELGPVWVDGSTVSRATLHNEDQINRLGLCVGDEVEVCKAAAVIPALVRSVTFDRLQGLEQDARDEFSLVGHINGRCPSCGGQNIQKVNSSETERVRESTSAPENTTAMKASAAWRCMNENCPAQLAGRIQHMCSRKALDIEGVGEEMARALADALHQEASEDSALRGLPFPGPLQLIMGIVCWSSRTIMTRWMSERTWVTESGGNMTFGEKRAKKAVAAVEAARKLPLHRWLYAFGIPTVGENTSKEISRLFRTALEIDGQLFDDDSWLLTVAQDGKAKERPDIARKQISHHLGPVSCQALLDFASSEDGKYALARLTEWDVESDNYNPLPEQVDCLPLAGQTFAITGTLSVGRDEMKDLIEKAGGKVSGTISKKLTALICGEGGGGKRDKAAAQGITTMTEADIRALL